MTVRASDPLLDNSKFLILETERLILGALHHSDGADVLRIRGDPVVQRYDDPIIHTIEEAKNIIDDINSGIP